MTPPPRASQFFASFSGITIAYREWGADSTRPSGMLHHVWVPET
jgi:hypothetical protein